MTGKSTDDDLCACERVSHGEFGCLENSERVLRVINTKHVTKDGAGLRPGAFPLGHLREKGLSLMRADRMGGDEGRRQVATVAGTMPEGALAGVAIATAQGVRAIADDDGRQMLCLFDDPIVGDAVLPDNRAHACALRSADQSDIALQEVQLDLIEAFKPVLKVEHANFLDRK